MYLYKLFSITHQNSLIIMNFTETRKAEKLMKKISKTIKCNNKKYIIPGVLRQIYRQFQEYRQLQKISPNNSLNEESELPYKTINAFECDVLKYLLERCYWIRYGDSEVVAYLLTASYDIVNNLGKIFDYRDSNKFWLFGKNCRINGKFFIRSTWVDANIINEEIKPVDYFITHAYKKKLLFGGQRFAEQYFTSNRIAAQLEAQSCLLLPPCSLSFQYPELLPKLLKYGLFVRATPKNADVGKLLTGIIGVFLNYPVSDIGPCGTFAFEYVESVKNMGNCLLRAIDSVDPALLLKAQKRSRKEVGKLMSRLSDNQTFTYLTRRCRGPQELQHLCRRKIRVALYDNWMLPDGIHKLPLPSLMKSYLNLEID